jgi:hypothetical protein
MGTQLRVITATDADSHLYEGTRVQFVREAVFSKVLIIACVRKDVCAAVALVRRPCPLQMSRTASMNGSSPRLNAAAGGMSTFAKRKC